MKKFAFSAPAWLLVCALACGDDTVQFRDRSAKPEKIVSLQGRITAESVNGIKVKPAVGAERDVPAADIIEITYDVPGAVKLTLGSAQKFEQQKGIGDAGRKAMQDAAKDYTSVLKGLNEKYATAARHMQYKLIGIQAALATDKVQLLQAADEFDKFRKAHNNAWQLLPAVRQQAQLLMSCDKFDDVAKIFDETSKNPSLSKESRQEVELLAIDAMM